MQVRVWRTRPRGRVLRAFVSGDIQKISQAELDYQTDRLRTYADLLLESFVAEHPDVFSTRSRVVVAEMARSRLVEDFRSILALPGRGPRGTIGRTLMRRQVNDLLYDAAFRLVPELAREAVQEEFDATLQGEYDRLVAGEITPSQWEEAARGHMQHHYRIVYQLGKHRAGEPSTLTDADESFLAETLLDEYQYLHRFAGEIQDRMDRGLPLTGRDQVRWDLYKRALRSLMEAAVLRHTDWVYWVLDPLADHCPDCPPLAAASPWPTEMLPTYPGEGLTECLTRCCCSLEGSDEPDEPGEHRERIRQWLNENWEGSFARAAAGAPRAKPKSWFTTEEGKRIPITDPAGRTPGVTAAEAPPPRAAGAAPPGTLEGAAPSRVPRAGASPAAGPMTGAGLTPGESAYLPRLHGEQVIQQNHECYEGNGTRVWVDTRRPPKGHDVANYERVAQMVMALPREFAQALDGIFIHSEGVRNMGADGRMQYRTGYTIAADDEGNKAQIHLLALPVASGGLPGCLPHEVGHVIYDHLERTDSPWAQEYRELFAASSLGYGDDADGAKGDYWLMDPHEDFACAFEGWWLRKTGTYEQDLRTRLMAGYRQIEHAHGGVVAEDWLETEQDVLARKLSEPSLAQWSPARAAIIEALWQGQPYVEPLQAAEPQPFEELTPSEYAQGLVEAMGDVPTDWDSFAATGMSAIGDELLTEGQMTGYNIEMDTHRYELAPAGDYSMALESEQDTIIYHQYMQHLEHGRELLRRMADAGLKVPYYLTTMGSTVKWDQSWDQEPELSYENIGEKGELLVGRSVQYGIVFLPDSHAQAEAIADFIANNAQAEAENAIEHSWLVPDVRACSEERVETFEERYLNITTVRDQDLMLLTRQPVEDERFQSFELWLNPELAEFIKRRRENGSDG